MSGWSTFSTKWAGALPRRRGSRSRVWITLAVLFLGVGILGAGPTAGAQSYGELTFPEDEHMKLDGLDYYWGAADIWTTAGNHYTLAMAYTGFSAFAASGHQLYAHQGPYEGLTLLGEGGPEEWGHDSVAGQLVTMSTYLPLLSERLELETVSLLEGGKVLDRFERKTLDSQTYGFVLDYQAAKVHPLGDTVRLAADLELVMNDGPPLMAGGAGTWWYGIPSTFGYPSRSFQYMQASRNVTGTLEHSQPDGTLLQEEIDPARSSWVMIHEYDATPEDIPAGLAAAMATQFHDRFFQYYQAGMPWDIVFVDLEGGVQLMLVLLAFHHSQEGLLGDVLGPLGVEMPTYRVLATVRLPSGESIALDERLLVERLSYREIVGRAPTAFVSSFGHWIQSWAFRVGFPGGTVTAGEGSEVEVPPFDLGLEPWIDSRMPALDEDGVGLTQRFPYRVTGQWDGCPARGSGWSENIINWHGRTHLDPWYTGGDLPQTPDVCGEPVVGVSAGNGRPLVPTPDPQGDWQLEGDGCQAYFAQPSCSYTAQADGAVGGYGAEPGGWEVSIERPGRDTPIAVKGFAGLSLYPCGIVQAGDEVTVTAGEGSFVAVGNPALCSAGNVFADDDIVLLPGPTTAQVRSSVQGEPAGAGVEGVQDDVAAQASPRHEAPQAALPATGGGSGPPLVLSLTALAWIAARHLRSHPRRPPAGGLRPSAPER